MVATQSEMLELGTKAPAFSLPDVISGDTISSDQFLGKPTVVAFISAHCPFVIHIQAVFGQLSQKYSADVNFVAISSNDVVGYPDDAPEKLAEQAKEYGFEMPYLYDETQEVAKSYLAACTPDMYVFDADLALVYRGQFDSSRPGSGASDGADVEAALKAVVAGESVEQNQTPSMGCNIKWRAGNEPSYFG